MEFVQQKSKLDAVQLLYCEEEHITPRKRYGPVIRSVYIVECCTAGSGSVSINGTDFPFQAGDCYILLPGDTVIHNNTHTRSGFWCALDGQAMPRYINETGITSASPFIPASAFEEVCHYLRQMTEQREDKDAGAALRQTACVYNLLGAILREKTVSTRGNWIDKAIGLMETNYPDPVNVAKLAREVGLDRTYFSILFKERMGVSPYQYLTSLRIQKACHLLEETTYSVTEVADLVGLDPHNFARIFKKTMGQSPSEYRNESKKWRKPIIARETLSPHRKA